MPDHCTAVPDKLSSYDMAGCCYIHDIDYNEQVKTRYQADIDFYHCLRRVAPWWIAVVYFVGVRIFGVMAWRKANGG